MGACCSNQSPLEPRPLLDDDSFSLNPVPGAGRAERNNAAAALVVRDAAVVAVGVGFAAGMVATAGSGACSNVGTAILEVSKGLPFVAPVAFLVAAVAQSASEAIIMKSDCYEFRRIIVALEKMLVKANNLQHHREDIEFIKETLQDALQLVDKFQQRGWLSAVSAATRDLAKLEDIKKSLHQVLQQMQLASTVDIEVFLEVQFEQAEAYKGKVEALGGAEACIGCEIKMQELQEYMGASDKLLIAKLDLAAKENRGTKLIAHKSLAKIEESLLYQQDMRADVTSKFADLQKEAEISRLRNELLERQVGDLRGLLGDIKDMMAKFPVPPSEPERLLQVHETGVMGMTKEAASYDQLEALAFETFERFNGEAIVGWNFLGEDKSFMPVMIGPNADIPEGGVESKM